MVNAWKSLAIKEWSFLLTTFILPKDGRKDGLYSIGSKPNTKLQRTRLVTKQHRVITARIVSPNFFISTLKGEGHTLG